MFGPFDNEKEVALKFAILGLGLFIGFFGFLLHGLITAQTDGIGKLVLMTILTGWMAVSGLLYYYQEDEENEYTDQKNK
jgi:hypothetical protein